MAEGAVEPAALAGLDQEDRDALLEKDRDGITAFERRQCRHCGGVHSRACPRIRRMRYTDSGSLVEVEYFPEGMWADSAKDYVVWPEMLGVVTDSNGGNG